MPVKRWRSIEYTYDGCARYQCLQCYKTWEGRTSPETYEWKFCPYCGILWEGRQDCLQHGEKYWSLLGWHRYTPAFYWLIETRSRSNYEPSEWGQWKEERILDGRYPAKEVLSMLRELRGKWEYNTVESQVKTIRQLPNARAHVWAYCQ
jgi:DNA-directed RNA polymerase subunit RPC12/RpoP